MIKRLAPVLSIVILPILFLSFSCQQDENLPPTLGKATFSLSPQTRNSGRVSGKSTPDFVLLNVKDSKGKAQENIRLPLYALGQSYMSENLDLQTGTYQLTQFTVLDAANQVIYATPLEGSELAIYVNDPLPMEFSIIENQGTQITPQVLAIASDDTAELFGLASFGFEVVNAGVKLHSEEFFTYDPTNAASTEGFVQSLKFMYKYQEDKLIQIDVYDYNHNTGSYDYPSYKLEEYAYGSSGELIRKVQFVGESGSKWIHEYEYLGNESIKVTRRRYFHDDPVSHPDWWIMKKSPSSLNVKYYQLNDEPYAELSCEIDGKGNVISMWSDPPLSGGKIYYIYDNSPNPNRFPELSGASEVHLAKYLSQNNVVEGTNDSNLKTTLTIEYNKEGYPVKIVAPTYKRLLTYQ
jgi:hypothetical protein